MGQEASMPQGHDDEFEHQARAPPSSSNPPGISASAAAVSSATKRHGKMIGSVFKSGRQNAHQHHHQQLQNHGQHNFESREISRAVAESGQIHDMEGHMYTNGGGPAKTLTTDQQQQQQQQQHPLYSSHQHHHQHQQGRAYHMQQQPQMVHNAYYQQQQQQQQPYPHQRQQQFAPSNQQPHHVPQQHPPPMNTQQQQQQQPPPQAVSSPMVGFMYAHNEPSSGSNQSSAKKPFRSSGRGAALINSMRNLSLSGAMQRATGGSSVASPSSAAMTSASTAASSKGEVNDWETKWDEDDDDSDAEDEAVHEAMQQKQQQQQLQQQQQQQHLHQTPPPPPPPPPSAMHSQLRPNIDVGHSTLSSSTATTTLSEEHNQMQKAQLHRQVSEEDGLEWDTGANNEGIDASEKPNVHMFLPLLRVLGKGSFGKVVLVQKRKGKERGGLFAMKILKKSHLVKRRQIERTRTERKVLSVVNHPFIMKLHYAFQTPDKLYLVLDYCPGGELFFHLSRFRRFPERVARFYAAELLLAIGHLHKRGIIYRDLKPENVLLDADGHVKLGDFGLAKAGIKHPCEGASSMCGTPEYMAPEVLSQQGHGFCVDYWGLGMLVYEMMTGLPPWYTTDRAKLFRRLKSAPLDIPSYFSVPSANCVSALLERNPRRRLGVTGIRTAMEHEFFRSISWRALYGRRVEAPIRPCEGWTPPEAIRDEVSSNGESTHPGAFPQNSFQMNEGGKPSDFNNSQQNNGGIEKMDSNDLDAATANFDNTFTRMPVETEDRIGEDVSESELEDLHEDTFVGFTFDDKDRDQIAAAQTARQRNYDKSSNGSNNPEHQQMSQTRQLD